MNGLNQRWLPGFTLLCLALFSGLAWRAELELRGGWAGLTWVRYFHWAVPCCVLAFLIWAVWVACVQWPSFFALALLVLSTAAYAVLDSAIRVVFFTRFLMGDSIVEAHYQRVWMIVLAAPWVWALLPLMFGALCRVFGVWVPIWAMLLSSVLFVLSWPLAIFVREFFDHRGDADLIHALKSGFVVPFLVFSLGLPLLFRRPVMRILVV